MAREMQRVHLNIPLLIGGATTSKYVKFNFDLFCTCDMMRLQTLDLLQSENITRMLALIFHVYDVHTSQRNLVVLSYDELEVQKIQKRFKFAEVFTAEIKPQVSLYDIITGLLSSKYTKC